MIVADVDELLLEKAGLIEYYENLIDDDAELYLITWSPNPEELPDADFETQHKFNISLLSEYLKWCSLGLFCVESTQLGNPHYHGWYQCSDDSNEELGRIATIKTLKRFGNLKISKVKVAYVKNSYSQKSNALYYYKKDAFSQMLYVEDAVIHRHSECTIDWTNIQYSQFFDKECKLKLGQKAENAISEKQWCLDFYRDSFWWDKKK